MDSYDSLLASSNEIRIMKQVSNYIYNTYYSAKVCYSKELRIIAGYRSVILNY